MDREKGRLEIPPDNGLLTLLQARQKMPLIAAVVAILDQVVRVEDGCFATHNPYHDGMMTHRFSRPIAWLLLAFILFATMAPIGDRPHDFLPVQVDRALAFSLMTAFFVIAYPTRWLLVGSICIVSAYGIEATQYLQPSRDPHIADANIKAIGSMIGFLLGVIANVLRQRLRRSPS